MENHVGEEVMRKLCQRLLDRKGMPNNWKTSVVSIYKGKALNCDLIEVRNYFNMV